MLQLRYLRLPQVSFSIATLEVGEGGGCLRIHGASGGEWRHWSVAPRGRLSRALTFTIANGKIAEIEVIGNSARFAELDVSIVD